MSAPEKACGKQTGRMRYRGRICVCPDGQILVDASSVESHLVTETVPDVPERPRTIITEDTRPPRDVVSLMRMPIGYRLMRALTLLRDD